jgi:hypothetical protein
LTEQRRCGGGAGRCGGGAAEVRRRCGGGAAEVRRRCGGAEWPVVGVSAGSSACAAGGCSVGRLRRRLWFRRVGGTADWTYGGLRFRRSGGAAEQGGPVVGASAGLVGPRLVGWTPLCGCLVGRLWRLFAVEGVARVGAAVPGQTSRSAGDAGSYASHSKDLDVYSFMNSWRPRSSQ